MKHRFTGISKLIGILLVLVAIAAVYLWIGTTEATRTDEPKFTGKASQPQATLSANNALYQDGLIRRTFDTLVRLT